MMMEFFNKVITCPAVELPEEVHEDVVAKYKKFKESVVPLSVVEEVLFNELEIYMKKSDIDRILKNIANKKEGQ